MTSEEIKQKQAIDLSTNGWLREVCLQLAQLNEKQLVTRKPESHDRTRPNQQRS